MKRNRIARSSRRRAMRSHALRAPRFFRPLLEPLEDRRLLTVSEDIVSQLTLYQDALSDTLDIATSLPLVGDQLADLQAWNTVFQDSVNSLASRVDSLTNGHHELAIPLPTLPHTFTFDLGLDAFLQVQTSGGVSATINPVLNVAFDLNNGVPSLDPTHTGLDIGFVIGLPDFELTASLNKLLYVKAEDDGTTFSGNLGFHFDTNFGIEAEFSGDAHVRLGLSVSLVDPALGASFNPRFFTDLELDWGFDTQGSQLKVPVIAFRDFSLDADSFMQGFLGDTVKGVQKFTRPMQPFIDMFEQPVPIVSAFDSSETMGDLFLKGAGLSAEQQDRFNTMVKIVKAVNTFDFSGTTGGAVINFGDILLTGDARQAGNFLFDTSRLQNVIDDIMNSPALQEVQEKLETVAEYVGFTADAGFKYPLLENPGKVVGSLLTGQPEVMFSYATGRQHFELGASYGVGIPDLLGFFLNAGIVFDASISVGYDTAGLLKFIQNGQPEALLHGFYIDNSIDNSGPAIPNVPNPRKSALYLQGHADMSASAIVTLSGGLYADISFELASNSNSTHVYLDDIITNLSNNVKVFNPSGRLYAAATIELTFDAPVGPDITVFKYKLSEVELLSFNRPRTPTPTLPLTVIQVTDQHTLLLDVTKMTPGGSVKVQPFHDFDITDGVGYAGDGIRVDYPNEIVLYIERKNDITTNYYNLIGLNGAVPDGVSIDIVDPFNVFDTEGAPDPQPAQTEPGVLLAGGKNVVYRYTDKPGGALATVLLVGGYGSNNLNGGTMTFGNFVPAARLDQAKNHFDNVTGYDASGQAYINARLDSVVAPANPAGIIGATMYGSRGGLMYGGPGNNSFFAGGPGDYEMVGGPWADSFTISPSYNGVPATYAIDGGPGDKNQLVVRVPTLEKVSFDNSVIVDKYTPTLKALAVRANAGLSATAHGIRTVKIVADIGSDVELGDTSELDIEFTIVGASKLSFGGSNAPDTFSVTSAYNFYGRKDRRFVRQLVPDGITGLKELPPGNYAYAGPRYGDNPILFDPYPVDYVDSPVYTVTRTFGNSGVTQPVTFKVDNPLGSSLRLNGRGASDTYNITQGLGSFLDIEIRDSDLSTQNTVNVDFRNPLLLPQTATLTNNVLRLNYFTPMTHFETRFWDGIRFTGGPNTRNFYSTSVAYTPAVFFGANVDLTFRTGRPFQQTIIDRDSPPIGQHATILFDGILDAFEAPGVLGWDAEYMGSPSQRGYLWYQLQGIWSQNYFQPTVYTLAYDTQHPETGYMEVNAQFYQSGTATAWNYYLQPVGSNQTGVTVLANAGNLTIQQSTIGLAPQYYSVLGNTGTILFKKTDGGVNSYYVSGNEGTINFETPRAWGFYTNAQDVFNVYGNSGTVNFNHTITGTYRSDGYIVGLDHVINVLGNTGVVNVNTTVAPFLINYGIETQVNVGNGTLAGVHGTINLANSNGRYGLKIDDRTNPGSGQPWMIDTTKTVIGDLTINYPNINLPVPYFDIFSKYEAFPETSSQVSLVQDPPFYQKLYNGGAFPVSTSAVLNFYNASGDVINQAISATGPTGAPLTFTATNLPPGLSINPSTGVISGTITPGASVASPYEAIVNVGTSQFRRAASIFWYVASGINISVDQSHLSQLEGVATSAAVSATNPSNRPVTFTVTGLPPGLSFNANASLISGTIDLGAAQNGPYNVRVHATDGVEATDYQFQYYVTGISLSTPANQINFLGESIHLALPGSTASGAPLVYSATGLPDGLSIDDSTGIISGVVTAAAVERRVYYAAITAVNGNDSAVVYFYWSMLPAGVSNYISIVDPGLQNSRERDNIFFGLYASSSLNIPVTYTVTGLPPGLHLDVGEGSYVNGTLADGAASASPYHVEITATDGIWSDTETFDWIVRPSGTIYIQNPGGPTSFVNDTVDNFSIYAQGDPGETLTYSATGLPPGLSIDGHTGTISGTILPVAAIPSNFQVSVTTASASDSATTSFVWRVLSSITDFFRSNLVTLPNPSGVGTFDLMSPEGTYLSASISPSAGVGLPGNVEFPYGFLTFTIEYLQPGQAADLTIIGLDSSLITDYYKHGATPANPSAHWYNFLFNSATDGDSAAGTGWEIVGGNMVLHLVDGGRGDDDVALNGIIFDIGGPAIAGAIINHPPVITSNGGGDSANISVPENTTAVTTVTATDADVGTTIAYSISGGADAARFAIDATTGALRFITALNFEAPTDAGADNVYDVIVVASDGSLSDLQTLTITVTNANEPPAIISNGGGDSFSISVLENTTVVTTVTGQDADAGSTLTYSISGGADASQFAINPSSGALTFISAPNFEAPGDIGADNVYEVVVAASDGSLTDSQSLTVTVTNANEPPTITGNGGGDTANINVAENTLAVTTVAATDPDAGTTIVYSISGGADAAQFEIDPSSGVLTFITAPNFEAPSDTDRDNAYEVVVAASDGSLTDSQSLTVTVTNANESPVITSNGGGDSAIVSVTENTTAVTAVSATDPDPGTTLTYSIVGGADSGQFSINATSGALVFVTAPNFEAPTDADANNSYMVIVQASDGSLTDSQSLTVTVTNVNESPTITSNGGGDSSIVGVSENTTAVTTVTALDPDAGTTLTYSISGGADAAKFAINASSGALTFIVAPDYEAPADSDSDNAYEVVVATSDGSLIDSQSLTVTVTNANESPVISSNGGGDSAIVSVTEDTTVVTTVTATDPDAGTTLTYSISGGADAAQFAINASSGALTFIVAPDYEAPADSDSDNTYEVVVATSDGSLIDSQSLTVTVSNANESPVITSNGGGDSVNVSVPENTTAVTIVTATDPDADTGFTYSISGGADAAKFTINATTGVLIFVTAPSFESPTDVGANNIYDVNVQASDGNLIDTQALSVTVTDVDEAAYTINGKVYKDVTGNGKSADDLAWSASTQVTLNLYRDVNGDGAYQSGDTLLTSTVTGLGGVYSFVAPAMGKYIIKEVVPSNFVRTFPVLSDFEAVNLTESASNGNDWYNAEVCDLSVVTNVSYMINHGGVFTTVADLRGNTHEGDIVTANFTVTATHELTLVTYNAAGPTWDPATASQQTVFDFQTATFTPGSYSLTADIPKNFYQIDFVCGPYINQLGPAGSNIFYSAQSRLISADNGGVNSLNSPAIDLALSTSVSNAAPLLGSNVVITVDVSNAAGWSAATGVRVKDALPSGLTFVSATATLGTYNSSSGEWNLVNPLNSGAAAKLTITATVATAGEKRNAAQVTAAGAPDIDSTPNNDTSSSTPHNEDDDDNVSIVPQLWTKYFVVNDSSTGSTREKTFEYASDGTAVENYQLDSGNTAPRGAATTATGSKVWVVDANKKVFVYDASGTLLGSWSAGGMSSSAAPEGIATNGADIWIVDAQQDKVFKYTNAASRTSGSQNAASSFALNSENGNPKDIVASSTHLWIVDDGSTDKVFKYTLAGACVGSWTITGGGGSPTGITLDPANVNHLWVADKSTDRVYQFNAAASRTSGSQSAASSFALGSGNTSPEGIADPPPSSTPAAADSREASRDKMSSYQAFDFALLAVIDEIDGSGIGRKTKVR